MKKTINNNNGILCINKPSGITSRDVVNKVCKIFNTRKVGHTGTLDPLATGVIILGINDGTKLIELITAYDKEYIARVRLGMLTDTLDITGSVLEKSDTSFITDDMIDECLKNFEVSYEQEVPIYSAVKINGKKLYEYARNNEEISLPKRLVTIYKLERVSSIERSDFYIEFDIKCFVSKGTYIRSLIRDIGYYLNTYGMMVNLKRTKQGKFNLDNSYTLEQIEQGDYKIIDIASILSNYKKVVVSDDLYKKVLNGALIENVYGLNEVLFVDVHSNVVALYKVYEKDKTKLKPWKMFKTLA